MMTSLISIASVTIVEGNTGTQNAAVTVNVSEPHSNAVSVDYSTAAGSATAGTDYKTVSGTLTFAKNEMSKTILIPVVGDLITTAISLWVVREARALGAPWHLTARMLGNVAVDGVVGLVPVAGDAFDVMFRANVRNVRMLKRWLDKQPR